MSPKHGPWAGKTSEAALRSALRETMRQYIRGDVVPEAADTPEVQVFVTEHGAMPTTLDDLQTSARVIPGPDGMIVLPSMASTSKPGSARTVAAASPA